MTPDLAFALRRIDVRGLAAKEQRRRHAISLLHSGWTQARVARHFGVSREAVRKWQNAYRADGTEGHKAHPTKGAPPKVDRTMFANLGELLAQPPEAHGLRGPGWTPTRVAQLIAKQYGVTYRATYMRRLLARLGVTWPGPTLEQRAA